MNAEATSLICTNSACNYSETGQCVEGNSLDECTFLSASNPKFQQSPIDELLPAEPQISSVNVGGEGHLSLESASALLKREYIPLIAFLGAVGSGKTSLIAEVYDAFQYKQYKSLRFAGSKTLMAFEQISHSVRAASRAHRPAPERTELTDDPLLFELRIAFGTSKKSIFLADRSGETYRQIVDKPELSHSCLELAQADIVNILVDGEKLCNPLTRSEVISKCTQLIQTLILTNALPTEVKVALVLTKLDAVDNHANASRAHSDFDDLPSKIKQQCGERNIVVNVFKVAACPHNANFSKGHGVEGLLEFWLSAQPNTVSFKSDKFSGLRSIDLVPSNMDWL